MYVVVTCKLRITPFCFMREILTDFCYFQKICKVRNFLLLFQRHNNFFMIAIPLVAELQANKRERGKSLSECLQSCPADANALSRERWFASFITFASFAKPNGNLFRICILYTTSLPMLYTIITINRKISISLQVEWA